MAGGHAMGNDERIRVYFVLGEASGDDLAADLHSALKNKFDSEGKILDAVGLAGPKLTRCGVRSLFDIEAIAVMGISAVIARLPKIIARVRQTVADIADKKPDVILLIDSPDFTHAVAKRVRKKLPDTPIINYVCPSVWAWRSGRAKKMAAYVDHVLAILPFEPEALLRLEGPPGTYVGHPLARKIDLLPKAKKSSNPEDKPILLVLPGSRGGELDRLLQPFGQALSWLQRNNVEFDAVIPAVPHLRDRIESTVKGWDVVPRIVDSAENDDTFAGAHAALAASGTVSLQLALHRVPMTLAYKLDSIARPFGFLITTWSAALPNLIAGWPLVPEDLNEAVNSERMGRMLERLLSDTPERAAQLAGFETIVEYMKTERPPAEVAADIILDHI